jgi:hypothetical protein
MISMWTLRRTGCALALLALLSGCGTGGSPDAGAIETLERQMWEEWKNHSLDTMRSRVTPEALVFGGEEIMDRDAAFAAMAKQTCDVQAVSLDNVKVTALAPAVALITYRANAVGACNGEPLGPSMNSSIWIQRDGMWQTIHHQQSVAVPQNRISGQWELNLSKSQFTPSDGAPRRQSRLYLVQGEQEIGRHTGIDPQGRPSAIEFTATYDGKEYPYTGSPDYDTVSLKRVDASTTAFTQSRGGKVVLTGTRVVSPDGRTLTISSKGTNAKGQAVDTTAVYDRR